MMYHYFLVDFNNEGYMYRVGIMSEKENPIPEIMDYLKQNSKDVLYETSTKEVKEEYLKTTRTIPCGKIFCTKFLFDKCIKVSKDHWSSKLRRDLMSKQDGKVYLS